MMNDELPGLALAAAITSAGDLAALVGGTTITLETPPTKATGRKSFTES